MLTSRPSNILLRQPKSATRRLVRNFFASSTDHTRLLEEAQIHCILQENGIKQYVLVADGVDEETVRKVPQLHLARLNLDQHKIFGAKVVNRTLGNCQDVCGRLLDVALNDTNGKAHAWSTLHDLSPWVLSSNNESIVTSLEQTQREQVLAIAKNESDSSLNKTAWEKIAMEYIAQGLSDESNLYLTKATFGHIEHNADTSDFANTCGGSMAVFHFS
jgi:hypothetical protein